MACQRGWRRPPNLSYCDTVPCILFGSASGVSRLVASWSFLGDRRWYPARTDLSTVIHHVFAPVVLRSFAWVMVRVGVFNHWSIFLVCFVIPGGGGAGRTLREVSLETPIRYGMKDPVESWLYRLLCLDTKVRCDVWCVTTLWELIAAAVFVGDIDIDIDVSVFRYVGLWALALALTNSIFFWTSCYQYRIMITENLDTNKSCVGMKRAVIRVLV